MKKEEKLLKLRQEKSTTLFNVPQKDGGMRLDRLLGQYFSTASFGNVQKLCRKGFIKIDGKRIKDNGAKVVGDQEISIPTSLVEGGDKKEEKAKKNTYQLTNADKRIVRDMILYEDDDILVVNKPYGVPVQAGSGHSKSIDRMLGAYFGEDKEPKLVHRLDKNTTGCLLLAKTREAAKRFIEAFKKRDMQKTYWLVCRGRLPGNEGTCTMRLLKIGTSGNERVEIHPEGQTAATEWRHIVSSADYNWVEAKPKTGRTHQIRVHMQYLGAPLIGDIKYGGDKGRAGQEFPKNKMFLHAREVVFEHPITGKEMRFHSDIPSHFKTVFDLMGWDESDAKS